MGGCWWLAVGMVFDLKNHFWLEYFSLDFFVGDM